MEWINAGRLSEIEEKGQVLARHGKRQIALFAVGEAIYAVDNRCPHEGYPLLQGTVDPESCLLTCQWHNWKFELATGVCVLGEDHVRSYPTRVKDGWIQLEVSEPTAESYRNTILKGVLEAVEDRQYTRIAREVSRLLLRGLDPVDALRATVARTHNRFEFGTTHAYAAAADWLELYAREDDPERRVICVTEAIDHLAHDALRHTPYPFVEEALPFDGPAFLDTIENEDEPHAVQLARGALEKGLSWPELEPWYARAALAHYNDFGHAAIYVYKAGALLACLGQEHASHVVLPLTRMLCYTTRDDLLPDFQPYAGHLARVPASAGTSSAWVEAPVGKSTKDALGWAVEHMAEHSPLAIYSALLEAAALNLLRFDERKAFAASRTVSQNVGWLDLTHALTFGNAVRNLCERTPELWPRAVLQMACFVGRNKRFVERASDVTPWLVEDEPAFFADAREQILDHGVGEPIFSVHLLKTTMAVDAELSHVAPSCRRHLVAALNRFLNARIKEKHPLRTARQALALAQASI